MSGTPDDPSDLPPDPFVGDPLGPDTNPHANVPTSDDFADMLRSMGMNPSGPSLGADDISAASSGSNLSGAAGLGGLSGLLGMLGGLGTGFNWDAARQSAIWTAANGAVEPTVDPLDRIRLVEAAQRAAAAVSEATGFGITVRSGGAKPSDARSGFMDVEVEVVNRAGWAAAALEDFRPLLTGLGAALSRPVEGHGHDANPMAGIFSALGPVMMSTHAGATVGELGKHHMGTYDWPAVRPGNRLTLVASSIDAFANEWAIAIADARLHVCIADVTVHTVLSLPHIRRKLQNLLERHADAAQIDLDAISEQIGRLAENADAPGGLFGLDLSALSSFNAAKFIGGSAEQVAIRLEVERVLRPLLGYVDYIVAIVGARLLGDNRQVMEAWKRRRVGTSGANAASLFGVEVTPATYEKGAAFVGGVLQRAGGDALGALWVREENLPTPSEFDAPGLWLARLGLD